MTAHYWNTHSGGRDFHAVVAENFFRFAREFHLLFGVSVIFKYIAVRDAIFIDGVSVNHRSIFATALTLHLLHGLFTGARHRLVRGYHHTFDSKFLVQRRQNHHELDGRTIRICDDHVIFRKGSAIDLRHDEFVVGRHTPGR